MKWTYKDLDRHVVQPDLRDSLGSLLTVFELRRHEAARRMGHLAGTGTDPGPSHASPALASLGSSPERLREYVRNATAEDEPVSMTIREFIGIWGHVHRWPSVVEEIEADLEAFGLTTQPSFADYALNLNRRVTVIPVGAEPEPGTHVPTAAELPVAARFDDRPVTVRIGQVASSDLGDALTSLTPDDDLSTAMLYMATRNFSQLPVLDADRRLVGVVSWESIGRAGLRGATSLTLADTIDRRAREVSGDEELLNWIPEIYDRGYVFVRNEDRAITGMVTAADLTRQLGSQLKPFLLVAEIERRLRRIVDAALSDHVVTIEQIRCILGPRASSVMAAKDLTMGQYRLIFQDSSVWMALGWRIDGSLFAQGLKAASTFRNNLMHLNPDLDAEDETELAPLEGLLTVLRSLDRTD
ncbi:CBS domain-containing protein [Streptacidiphilus rugosus]|uniref:CBS domain-containing protein n=1 Tax=Streptacidiphilus rugosus TaxID=405783 RepID=UPI00056D1B06|nr:CBS domain-containing protein [Streptacidiphilus rugosus]